MFWGQCQVAHRGPLGLHWPPLQQGHQKTNHFAHQIGRTGTMRAVLTRPLGTRPCTGTGVFLPRQVGSQLESRKKQSLAPASSPVLIPAKVVQALNMSYESMGSQPQQQLRSCSSGRFTSKSGNASTAVTLPSSINCRARTLDLTFDLLVMFGRWSMEIFEERFC